MVPSGRSPGLLELQEVADGADHRPFGLDNLVAHGGGSGVSREPRDPDCAPALTRFGYGDIVTNEK